MIFLIVRKKYRLLVCYIVNVFFIDFEVIVIGIKFELKGVLKEV